MTDNDAYPEFYVHRTTGAVHGVYPGQTLRRTLCNRDATGEVWERTSAIHLVTCDHCIRITRRAVGPHTPAERRARRQARLRRGNVSGGHGWLRVVGAQDSDSFWWVCDRCPDVSDVMPEPQRAYGLALGHASWHKEPESVVSWGGPVTRPLSL